MTWKMNGTYFETCNCDVICPCTWSGFVQDATHDRCKVVLTYHIDDGNVDGIDVSGLSFAVVADTPKNMATPGWRLGVCIDDNASEDQAGAIGQIVSGERGGPMAALAPLVGEMLGVERVPIRYESENGKHRSRIGATTDLQVEDLHIADSPEPVQLRNIVSHPSNSTLTVSPASHATADIFGVTFEGASGFSAPFHWAG